MREDIYTDPGLLINEITPENFDKFWTKMKPIFRKTADEHKNAILKLVHLKEVVADFIWFVLAGAFTISVSNSNISSVPCQQTAEQMEESHQDDIDNNVRKGPGNAACIDTGEIPPYLSDNWWYN